MPLPLRAAARVLLCLTPSCASPGASLVQAPAAAPAAALQGALGLGDDYFPGLGNGGYDVERYELELELDMEADALAGRARIAARALQDLGRFSLDLYGLEVESVEVDGAPARFERPQTEPDATGLRAPPSELVIEPAHPLAKDASFTVEVRYSGEPVPRPDASVPFLKGVGWTRKESGVYVVSECVGASTWFPCNDHPRDKASLGLRVRVARPWTVAANGRLVEVVDEGESRTFVFDAREPMATYLATLNVAEFTRIDAEGPRGIPVTTYHPSDASDEELAGFRRQPEVLEFLESRFGPYPFESAGAVLAREGLAGALECQTLPVYGREATDVVVVVHELAHQWFGDCVTPELWRDMWLNEGFASYAEWLWAEHVGGPEAYALKARAEYASLRERRTGSPYDPGVKRVFSSRVYKRGAMVLYGLRAEVGDETFFRTLREWVSAYRDGNAGTRDFVAHASRVAGRDLAPFFDAWLFSEVTPEVAGLESPAGEAPATSGR